MSYIQINRHILPQRLILPVIAIASVLFLTGCPYSAHYTLDETPKYQVEPNWLGKWAAISTDQWGKQRPVKMILAEKTEALYELCFIGNFEVLNEYGYALNDSIFATGYTSVIADRTFMDISLRNEHYLAEIKMDEGKLSFLPLSEHFTNRIVRSGKDIKQALYLHFKTRLYPLYDEPFCLREMVKVN